MTTIPEGMGEDIGRREALATPMVHNEFLQYKFEIIGMMDRGR